MRGTKWLVWAGAALGLGGCYRTTVKTDTVMENRYDHRLAADAKAPLLHSSWQVESDAIRGRLDVQQCQVLRGWTSLKVRNTARTANRAAGWGLVGLASVAAFIGAVTESHEPVNSCGSGQTVYNQDPRGCFHDPDNTVPYLLVGTGAVLALAGLITVAPRDSTTSEVLDRQSHSTSVTESCLTAADLKELLLVARAADGRIWPVRLSSTAEARIPLPQTPDVPRGVELKLVVYRAPRESGGMFQRGLVLDTFQLPP